MHEGRVLEFLSSTDRVVEACSFVGAHGSGTWSVREGHMREFLSSTGHVLNVAQGMFWWRVRLP